VRKDGRPESARPGAGFVGGINGVSPGGDQGAPPPPPPRYVQTRDCRGRARPVVAAVDPETATSYPALWEYLTCQLVGDQGRLTATLLVMAEEQQVKLCLSDRETDQVCWRSSTTLRGALEGLEMALAEGTAEWRGKKPYTPKRG
jgi:hypothetical protein